MILKYVLHTAKITIHGLQVLFNDVKIQAYDFIIICKNLVLIKKMIMVVIMTQCSRIMHELYTIYYCENTSIRFCGSYSILV